MATFYCNPHSPPALTPQTWSVGEVVKSVPGKQQIAFATFIACELQKNHLPYAVDNDNKFYDGGEGAWRPEM